VPRAAQAARRRCPVGRFQRRAAPVFVGCEHERMISIMEIIRQAIISILEILRFPFWKATFWP
jgi:hypothetical protein